MSAFSSAVISYTQSFRNSRKSKYEKLQREIEAAERRLEKAESGSPEESCARGSLYILRNQLKNEKMEDQKEWRLGLKNYR